MPTNKRLPFVFLQTEEMECLRLVDVTLLRNKATSFEIRKTLKVDTFVS